jgi:hypothetical protein
MTNYYHIIHKEPYLTKEDMPIQLENLANKLADSGLVRIDTDDKSNFARFSLPEIDFFCTFTKRQLFQDNLLANTKKILARYSRNNKKNINIQNLVENHLAKLRYQVNNLVPVDEELELKICRVIVQLTHPIVVELILLERVEIYISYGHTIGDMLSISSWQHNRSNNGMQSLDQYKVAIYVSCNGDPFYKERPVEKSDKKEKKSKNEPLIEELTYGHGRPALARLIIVGGQEFGHYSDLIRINISQYISRHASDIYCNKANYHVKIGRLADMHYIQEIKNIVNSFNFEKLQELEKEILFYRRQRVNHLRILIIKLYYIIVRKIFFRKVLKLFPALKEVLKYHDPIIMLVRLFEDMAFNLAPQADVYQNSNKQIEEAIACVEALARVPQQCNKWGHSVVKLLYNDLYKIYYYEVIPQCIKDYQRLTQKKFTLYHHNMVYIPFYKKYLLKAKKYFFKKNI